MGDLPLLGTNAQIIRIVEALFGVQPGNVFYTNFQDYVADTSLDALSNALVGALSPADSAALAATVAANYQVDPELETEDGSNVVELLETFITAQLNTVPEAEWGAKILEITNQYSNLWNNELLGESVIAFNDSVVASLVYSTNPANPGVNDPDETGPVDPPQVDAENLTTGQDDITGTDVSEIFNAFIFNNSNTLQSGDMVDGAGGIDTLFADIGNSQSFAITPHTESIEKLLIRAETTDFDNNENNMHNGVQIDAERMHGTTWYESNNSRADVTIEDVRILRTEAYGDESDQVTENVTVAMVSTDPGNVDLGVYFDQHSLVNEGDRESNSITLAVGNQIEKEFFDEENPLENIPYKKVAFIVNDAPVVLDLDLTDVTTYDQMWEVMEAAFLTAQEANPALLGDVTIARLIDSDNFFSRDADPRVADEYMLTIGEGSINPSPTVGWAADGLLPPNNAFSATVLQGDADVTSNLITANILLDDVGRGSMGGDLIVGGLSIGQEESAGEGTSNSQGVEQFDIIVEKSSQLQEIQSTNNTLEVVNIVNGDTKGDLTVAGDTNLGFDADDLPGTDANGAGFLDVRVLDASEMVGSVDIDAELSSDVVAKYMNRKDSAADPSADNIDFNYDLGKNDDSLDLLISQANLAAAGSTTREDFFLEIDGNGGDDTITTMIGDGWASDFSPWYINSTINANLTVSGNAGNDTIRTVGAGNFNINGGSGDDTVYANNDSLGNFVFISGEPVIDAPDPDGVDEQLAVYTIDVAGTVLNDADDTVTLTINGNTATAFTAVAAFADTDVANGIFAGSTITLDGVVYDITQPGGNDTTGLVLSAQTAPANNANSITITAVDDAAEGVTQPTTPTTAPTANGIAEVTEQFTVTYTAGNDGETIQFDGETIVLVDTNLSGEVESWEVTAQIADAVDDNGGDWDALAGFDTVTFTATTPGDMDDVNDVVGFGTYNGEGTFAFAGAATWLVNAENTSITNLESQENIDNSEDAGYGLLYKATLTVAITSAVGVSTLDADSTGNKEFEDEEFFTNGFESTVTVPTTDFVGTQLQINQAIKEAVNGNEVLNKVLLATDGPGNTLVITSLVDGEFDVESLEISMSAPTADDLTSSDVTALEKRAGEIQGDSDYDGIANEEDAIAHIQSTIDAFEGEGGINGLGVDLAIFATDGNGAMTGTDSDSVSDNLIDLGTGDDVAVLGTDATSNDTLIFEGSFGNNTVFNFVIGEDDSTDMLDFTYYLDNKMSVSDSVLSEVRITTSIDDDEDILANEVSFVTFDSLLEEDDTFAGLTGKDLLDAFDTDNDGDDDYANFDADFYTVGDSDAENDDSLVGSTVKAILMVENDLNEGEYKVFEMTAKDDDAFTSIDLVGTVDFGDSIDGLGLFNLV